MGTQKLHSRMPTFVALDTTISPASIALEGESMSPTLEAVGVAIDISEEGIGGHQLYCLK
jgi:hypothetical protein